MDNTKYDVSINGVGYRIRGYNKSEAPTFIPRVGAGGQTETEFNTLLSRTIRGFEGGSLQRYWKEDDMVFATEGLFPAYQDGTIYPTPAITEKSDVMGKAYASATVKTKDYLFVAVEGWATAPSTVKRIDVNGSVLNITLPAEVSDPNKTITDMVIWGTDIWVTAVDLISSTYAMAKMVIGGSSMSLVVNGSGFFRLCVWNNELYGTWAETGKRHAVLFRVTSVSPFASVEVGRVPNAVDSDKGRLFVWNNRLALTRNDGLYVYDGVKLQTVEDLTGQVDNRNYQFAVALRGYIYYHMPDGMYRTNGSLIEKLYDVSECGTPVDMVGGKNRLWFVNVNSLYSWSNRYDRSMGYDFTGSNEVDGRLMCYDGKGLFTYGRVSSFMRDPANMDFAGQGEINACVWWNEKVFCFTNYYKDLSGEGIEPNGKYYVFPTNETKATVANSWKILSSIFDADLPMVDKNLENIELSLDGVISADQAVTLEFRTSGFAGSTGWQALGEIKTQTELKRYVWKSYAMGVTFRRIQFRLSGSTNIATGIAKVIVRYKITPDLKWQWNMTALCYGDDPTAPLMLADGSQSNIPVSVLRGTLYKARMSDTPAIYVDVDQLDLSGALSIDATSISLNSTSLLKEEGFVQIENELIYYSSINNDILQNCVRGCLGTTPATHPDNSKVFPAYRVSLSISGESISNFDDRLDTIENKSRTSEMVLQLREV